MKFKSSNLLGIAVGDREFALAQVAAGKGGRLQKWARWPVPDDASPKRPEATGKRLRAFLDEKGIRAREAIVGVPARWLIAETAEVPGGGGGREQALAVLRLRAERLSMGDEHGVVFDAATFDAAKDEAALLVGIDAQRLEQLRAMLAAAGLEVRGVTATGLALAETLRRETGEALVLFGGHGTELVRRNAAGRPVALRHLNGVPTSGDVAGRLTGELARALSLGGEPDGPNGSGGSIALVGGPDFSDADVAGLSNRLGRDVHAAHPSEALGELPAVAGLNGEAAGVTGERAWPAVALAALGARGTPLPVNFLDPKLAPPPAPRFDRKVVYGTMAAMLLAGGLGWLYLAARQAEQDAVLLEARVAENAPAVESAEKLTERVRFGRGFYEQAKRPPALPMLADLARAFPEGGGIWAGGVSMRGDGKGQLQGRAADQRLALSLRDKLMGNGDFADVALQSLNQSTGANAQTSFALGFNYQPKKIEPATQALQ